VWGSAITSVASTRSTTSAGLSHAVKIRPRLLTWARAEDHVTAMCGAASQEAAADVGGMELNKITARTVERSAAYHRADRATLRHSVCNQANYTVKGAFTPASSALKIDPAGLAFSENVAAAEREHRRGSFDPRRASVGGEVRERKTINRRHHGTAQVARS